jgi:hypothetical protein
MFTCFACLLDGSAVDQFKKHLSHLEEGGGATPPQRQHTSLPRFLKHVFGSGQSNVDFCGPEVYLVFLVINHKMSVTMDASLVHHELM